MITRTLTRMGDLFAAPPAPVHKGVKAASQYLIMRDGTQIAVDVMLPADLAPGARLPVIMIMARYWRSMELRVPDRPNKALIGPREPLPDYLIPRGFALVVVDGRGTGASMGSVRYPWSPEELADYAEVAEWAAAQAWSSGKIGACGISYEGATALRLAGSAVDAVRAVVPQEIEYDIYTDIALPGGIFNAAFIRAWHDSNTKLDSGKPSNLFPWTGRLFTKGVRPVDADRSTRTLLAQALAEHQANTNVFEAMQNITYRDDEFGSTGATLNDFSVHALAEHIEASGAALFSWGSWLDGASAESALRTYNSLSNPQIAVIGAWKHEMTAHGSPFLPPNAKPNPPHGDQWGALAQFFEQTLKQDQLPVGKTLFYYTLGAETWKQTTEFPLPNTDMQTWYFQADHGLAPELPPAASAHDDYAVDFAATTGKLNRWNTQMAKPLVYKDRAQEDRRLLTYTSAPLDRDLEITGYPVITLHVASSADDGAFFAYLEDVDEKGVVRYLTEGELRGIHRKLSSEAPPYVTGMPQHSFKRADAAPMPVHQTVELTFGLQPISTLIRRGHCLRVALAGADADTFVRIPAQGAVTWKVSRSRALPSCISLPVVG
ncbi:MAG: CocE/NonD family hydrolase [Anaerolinea sp.]|nr:CocE/NonD family hydrolase [Anaerolinea sp.]